jgi:hypothetical protein
MRLPDFLIHEGLTALKARMGIAADSYGKGRGHLVKETLTDAERKKLVSGEGIEVSWNDLKILQNDTIVFKGERVLLYIRDVSTLGDKQSEPRYHLATCSTIERMHAANRITRYVVAQHPNGLFSVNITSNNRTHSEMRRLSVCQNCLAKLSFEGFRFGMLDVARRRAVDQFTPEKFFSVYPKSPHTRFPKHDEYGAPLNDYTRDFRQISLELRARRGWKCDQCHRVFIGQRERKFLHVHHCNGERWNNSEENLEVLCVGCHANEPSHAHMKDLPIYREFIQRFP